MISILACLAVLISPSGDTLPSSLLGRSLTWDPQGLVAFDVGYRLTDQDKKWLGLFQKGEYAQASANAKQECLGDHPSFFAIWVVAESARVRKDLSEFINLTTTLLAKKVDDPLARYANYRLLSLRLASTSSGIIDQKNRFIQNPEFAEISKKLHEVWLDCQEDAIKHIPIAVALATGPELPREVRNVVLKAVASSQDRDKLLLWKARALMLGNWAFSTNLKTGEIERDGNGQPKYFFLEGREPNLEEAQKALDLYHSKYPNDPKYLYYHARILSWTAFFFTTREIDKKAKTDLALSEMRKFLEAKDQPPPLVESAQKFLKKPNPGAFKTKPTE